MEPNTGKSDFKKKIQWRKPWERNTSPPPSPSSTSAYMTTKCDCFWVLCLVSNLHHSLQMNPTHHLKHYTLTHALYLQSSSLCLGHWLLIIYCVWLTTPTGHTITLFCSTVLSLELMGVSSMSFTGPGGCHFMMTVTSTWPVNRCSTNDNNLYTIHTIGCRNSGSTVTKGPGTFHAIMTGIRVSQSLDFALITWQGSFIIGDLSLHTLMMIRSPSLNLLVSLAHQVWSQKASWSWLHGR